MAKADPPRPRPLRRVLRWTRNLVLWGAAIYLSAGFLTLHLNAEPESVSRVGRGDANPLQASGGGGPTAGEASGAGLAGFSVVRGVLSVHTGRSHDAEGTLDEVARAASRTGLDFVFLGDHPGEWLDQGPEVMDPRRSEGVLLVPGLELAISGVGRTLAIGLDTLPARWEGSVADLSERANRVGAFLSVVHPRSPRSSEHWNGLSAPGLHAWESFDISEMARLRLKDPWATYHVAALLASLTIRRGELGLRGLWRERTETPALLSYDSARAARPVTLTGGLNHHPKARVPGGLFPAYEPFFRTVVNHVLVEGPALDPDPVAARGQILDALKAGRVYVTLGGSQGAEGFRFQGAGHALPPVEMGGRAPWRGAGDLRLRLPTGGGEFLVRVLRGGQEAGWMEARAGEDLRWPVTGPGIYRVEVFRAGVRMGGLRLGFRPWILSNPVEFYAEPSSQEGAASTS